MKRDYAQEDKSVDDELNAIYGKNQSQDVKPSDDVDDDAETEDLETSETQEMEGEAPEDMEESPMEEPEAPMEKTIPESQYKASVAAMNKSQQEAAMLRKEAEALRKQLEAKQGSESSESEQSVLPSESKQDESEEPMIDLPEELKDVDEMYPEIAKPLIAVFGKMQDTIGQLKSKVDSMQSIHDAAKQEKMLKAHWDDILSAHDDADGIADSEDYLAWYADAPPIIQKMLKEGSSKDVIAALDVFRSKFPKAAKESKDIFEEPAPEITKDVTVVSVKPSNKLDMAKGMSPPNIKSNSKLPDKKPSFTLAQITKMSPKEFADNEEAIDAAMSRGEIK